MRESRWRTFDVMDHISESICETIAVILEYICHNLCKERSVTLSIKMHKALLTCLSRFMTGRKIAQHANISIIIFQHFHSIIFHMICL